MAQLTFDADTHTYYLDGAEVPSVSEITKPLSAYKYADVDENVLEAAADRGTEIHFITTLIDNGEDIDGEYPAEYGGYIEAYRLYLSEHNVVHIARETPVYHPGRLYAGTPDAISIVDGEIAIVDYKCVASVNKIGVKTQVNAYKAAYEALEGLKIERLYCLQLMNTGEYRLYAVTIDGTEFDACMTLWAAFKKKQPRGKII
jgi:hypothetical protein